VIDLRDEEALEQAVSKAILEYYQEYQTDEHVSIKAAWDEVGEMLDDRCLVPYVYVKEAVWRGIRYDLECGVDDE
jgi:hypothetical protein